MKKKEIIKVKSSRFSEHSTTINTGGQKYLVLTELDNSDPPTVKTMVYQEGMVIDIIKSRPPSASQEDIQEVMDQQHRSVVQKINTKQPPPADKVEYFRKIKLQINKDNLKEALKKTEEALTHYPDEPLLLSYHGLLLSKVEANHEEGIVYCKNAIKEALKGTSKTELELFLPTLYLNLGRVYLYSGRRKEAIEAFHRGLNIAPNNMELFDELYRLGIRRSPVIPFLSRSHPINKYLGLWLSKLKRIFSRQEA